MDRELLKSPLEGHLQHRQNRVDRTMLVFAALMGASLAGCALVELLQHDEEPPLVFSHNYHIEEEGLECSECHLGSDSEEEPGMPRQALCMLCHEDLDEEKPPEMQVVSLFDGKLYLGARVSALTDEVVFSHLAHVEAGSDCETCHPGVATSDRILEDMGVTMDECIACHDDGQVPNECASCHQEIDRDWRPTTHDATWTSFHGAAARSGSKASASQCETCHTESSCVSCHSEEMPAGHTNYWRRRGHALNAAMDRSTCATCHRTDFCDRCHRDTQPLSHTGMWGSTRNRHCIGCHFPLKSTGCAMCHKGAPSHSMAAPQPPGHNPASNCRQCHGSTAPLPHVDKGDDCTLCHH